MKKFLIKVNGNQYEVEVEEISNNQITAAQTLSTPARSVEKPVEIPKVSEPPKFAPATVKNDIPVPTGATTVKAPMPGTVLRIDVNVGDRVSSGQVLLILEAMKMENEITSPVDGTVTSINVSSGSAVNAGEVLVSLA